MQLFFFTLPLTIVFYLLTSLFVILTYMCYIYGRDTDDEIWKIRRGMQL